MRNRTKRGGKVKEEQRELGINSFFLSSPSVFYGIFFLLFWERGKEESTNIVPPTTTINYAAEFPTFGDIAWGSTSGVKG